MPRSQRWGCLLINYFQILCQSFFANGPVYKCLDRKHFASYLFDEKLITHVEKEDGEITNPSVKHQQFEVDWSMQGRRERGQLKQASSSKSL